MIEDLRVNNLQKQVNSIRRISAKSTPAINPKRDDITGKTRIQSVSGGVYYATKLNNSRLSEGVIKGINFDQKTITQKQAITSTTKGLLSK